MLRLHILRNTDGHAITFSDRQSCVFRNKHSITFSDSPVFTACHLTHLRCETVLRHVMSDRTGQTSREYKTACCRRANWNSSMPANKHF